MTTREAAHYLHVYGIQAVYGLIKTRDLPFRLVGKGYRFAQHELDAWSTRHRQVRESGSHDTKVATKADSATATALNP
jgi:excisionase family DNA binding protein